MNAGTSDVAYPSVRPSDRPTLAYSLCDSDRANDKWGANCGPHALAAALGLSLAEVRDALNRFPGFSTPTLIEEALEYFGVRYRVTRGLKTKVFCRGINRIQWEGSWLNPGVPKAAAYKHTHWVAYRDGWIVCTAVEGASAKWVPAWWWQTALKFEVPHPWHITHHYQVAPLRIPPPRENHAEEDPLPRIEPPPATIGECQMELPNLSD